MSGHSKWSTIKNKKEKADNARAKVFTKISREIYVAVKNFGADVESNRKLRDLIAKAKANNIPGDNIDRVIKKAAGDVDKNCYEEIVYEGYGPGGVAVMVEALTDKRTRTAANVRHYFDKFGGKLAATGCVSFVFESKGFVAVENENGNLNEDTAMELCLDIGAEDFDLNDESLEFLTDVAKLNEVCGNLQSKNFKVLFAEVRKVAKNFASLSDEESLNKLNLLVQSLEDDDDVQQVWTNFQE